LTAFFTDFLVVAPDFAAAFFLTALFLLTVGFVVVAPAVARLECFARARAVFFCAASAGELSANEATSATSSAVSVLRIIIPPGFCGLR
jgi:hypothetical protein